MRSIVIAITLACLTGPALAQQSPSPPSLPASVNDAEATGTTSLRFDPNQLELKRVDDRYQIWAGKQFLRDFGPLEREAIDATRLIRALNFNQYATIAGATPAFEIWLSDGEGAKGGFIAKNVIPFNAGTLQADQVLGAWVIRDDKQLLYNFGARQDAALQGLAVLKRFGFNQLGVIGMPKPAMTYLTVDSYARAQQPMQSKPDPREMLSKIAEQGLILPKIGYAGRKVAIETRKLDVARLHGEWLLVQGKDVVGRFGPNSTQAREALRSLQDAHVTELCQIGTCGFPIFLCNGMPPRHSGLGFNNVHLQPAQMKIQVLNGAACITHGERIIFEFGSNRADAELVLKVLQHFQFDQYCPLGDVTHGGVRLFVKSR